MKDVVFDLNNLNPGTWFAYGDSEVARVSVRVCAGDDLREIRKKSVKTRIEYKNGQRFQYEQTNDELYKELIWDHCIVDWEGFIDGHGNEIPCTKENKILLMGKSVAFASFIGNCLEKLDKVAAAAEEEEEKN